MNYSSIYNPAKKLIGTVICSLCFVTAFSQMNPLPIGTMHPGDSVVIIYDLTIDNPIPGGVTQVTNQGTCSGSNFVSLLTDQPFTPAFPDATITLLNVVLPVTLTKLSAVPVGNIIVLNWDVVTEYNMVKYEIERSSDGRNFTKIGELPARNATGKLQYEFPDRQPLAGNNFYRLHMIDLDGTEKYSLVIRVSPGETGQLISTFPNPVVSNAFTILFSNAKKGDYQLDLYNSIGGLVLSRKVKHAGGSASQLVPIGKLVPGTYLMRVAGDQSLLTKKIIIR